MFGLTGISRGEAAVIGCAELCQLSGIAGTGIAVCITEW